MKLRRRQESRPAFTLVELLVVITIILILMSLLLAGINKIWSYVDEVKTTNEIAQLSQACESFKAKFGRYPPSRIALWCMNAVPAAALQLPANDANGELTRESVEFLQAVFPGIDLTSGNASSQHDWTGTGYSSQAPLVLEGQECLVYFLGGLRYLANGTYSGFTGFCSDPIRPTFNNLGVPGSQRVGPFFDFDLSRITSNPINNPNAGNSGGFFGAYLDPYKTVPYAYFAARSGASNNYATLQNIALWGYTQNSNTLLDCFSLINAYRGDFGDGTAFPYMQAITPPPNQAASTGRIATYHRPSSFQIVSAGKDKLFGGNTMPQNAINASNYGNPWSNDSSNPFLSPNALDNITNFSGGVLVPK